jgi:hypothetical protein
VHAGRPRPRLGQAKVRYSRQRRIIFRLDPKTGYHRKFIAARITDNPYLATTEYARFLDTLPDADRKTLKEGRWDAFAGAVFSEWNPAIHVCQPFPIPVGWEIWRGGDDGYNSPAAILWFARDPIHDRIYVVRELYRSGMTAEQTAHEVKLRDKTLPILDGEIRENGETLTGVIDSSAFADTGFGGRADVMNRLNCNWKPCEKGDRARLAGKSLIHARLAPKDDGKPGLVFFSNCVNAIRTIPALCYSKTHPEDIDTDAEDHAYDALRYGLTRRKIEFKKMRVRNDCLTQTETIPARFTALRWPFFEVIWQLSGNAWDCSIVATD